jgi:hypothetical protein
MLNLTVKPTPKTSRHDGLDSSCGRASEVQKTASFGGDHISLQQCLQVRREYRRPHGDGPQSTALVRPTLQEGHQVGTARACRVSAKETIAQKYLS